MCKVNNKDTRTRSITFFKPDVIDLNDIYTFSSVSIVEFGNVMLTGMKWLILLQNVIQKSQNVESA